MKKMILSAAVLAIVGMTTVNAELIKAPVASETVLALQDKTPVKAEELPDAVKGTLSGDDYSGWTVKEASLVKAANGSSHYEISVVKGEETKVVNLDGTGKTVGASAQPTVTR